MSYLAPKCVGCIRLSQNKKFPKLEVGFRFQPKDCRQPYPTRPTDIVMPSARDFPTGDPLGSFRRKESRVVSMRVEFAQTAQKANWSVACGDFEMPIMTASFQLDGKKQFLRHAIQIVLQIERDFLSNILLEPMYVLWVVWGEYVGALLLDAVKQALALSRSAVPDHCPDVVVRAPITWSISLIETAAVSTQPGVHLGRTVYMCRVYDRAAESQSRLLDSTSEIRAVVNGAGVLKEVHDKPWIEENFGLTKTDCIGRCVCQEWALPDDVRGLGGLFPPLCLVQTFLVETRHRVFNLKWTSKRREPSQHFWCATVHNPYA
ncbi:hypothetical protein EVAR_6711_1 [Eumeta japonica]|uniref:Uncharacterized protein n=1 Tax=Eumeta variegata TaxID=151549 RepID=A0A4C1TMY4_EUMVA|nr:hypothetical protein EVAR_6711_1 [Eumeta japonica]